MERRETQDFIFKQLKAVDDQGTFTGLAAAFNNVDQGGDRILPGAFSRTLAANKQFPLLWQHDTHQPIGSFTAVETSAGLQVTGKLLLEVPQAKTARALLQGGVLKGMSIGFTTQKADYDDEGVRELKEVRLFEASLVTFPMNESAMVQSIKALSDDAKAEHLAAISTHQKAIAHHSRGIAQHMKALCGVDDDEPAGDTDDDGSGDEEMSMLIQELKGLVETAQELA